MTDGEGIYRLTALPVGTYDLTAELQGFASADQKAIIVNVSQTVDIDLTLKVAGVSEAVEVRGATPLIENSSSAVGGVVDVARLESMPLNGRQFANAAVQIPGVGLGFHSDPTKSTQYSPQIRQPFTQQTSVGWSHQIGNSTALDIDYVHISGKDLGVRWNLNTRINLGARRWADLGLSPDNPSLNMSIGQSTYDGINFGIRRRLTNGLAWNAWYTLSKAEGLGGFGVDELTTNLVQDATNVFADVQYGPSQRTDARHKLNLSAMIEVPGGFTVSPVFTYRSALPIHIWHGIDLNGDGVINDIYPTAYKFKSVDDAGTASFEEIGPCETINCGRGSALSSFNLRVAKSFALRGSMRIEAFADIFNLFNAINPGFGAGVVAPGQVYTGTTLANQVASTVFMKPTAYAGDSGMSEQRIAQLGFRFTF